MVKDKQFRFICRGFIDIKGLGLRTTYFVEPLHEGEEPGTLPPPAENASSTVESTVLIEVKPCRANLPPLNHAGGVTPSVDEEKDGKTSLHPPQVMDSIKPHPSKQAWVQNRKRSGLSHETPPDDGGTRQQELPHSMATPGDKAVEVNSRARNMASTDQIREMWAAHRNRWRCTIT